MPVVLFAVASVIAVADAAAQADPALLRKGESVWKKRECAACHGLDAPGSAPFLGDVTQRRSREWLYRWLNDSKKMAEEDSTAKDIVATYKMVMPRQHLSPKEVDAVLAFIQYRAAKIREERGLQPLPVQPAGQGKP
jgi:mono/diheme cytochrome c family protein